MKLKKKLAERYVDETGGTLSDADGFIAGFEKAREIIGHYVIGVVGNLYIDTHAIEHIEEVIKGIGEEEIE